MPKVLVIDDNSLVRYALTLLIEKGGYEVFEASDGIEGERIHIENHVDLLITDIVMEGIDGLEVIRNFKKITPDMKIIAISGGGHLNADSMLTLAERAGADSIMSKPVDQKKLLSRIAQLLEGN